MAPVGFHLRDPGSNWNTEFSQTSFASTAWPHGGDVNLDYTCKERETRRQGKQRPALHPKHTAALLLQSQLLTGESVRAILLPVCRPLSVLGVSLGCGAAAGGRLLLGQLVSVGLLSRLHDIWHHRIDERQRLDGPPIKKGPVLHGRESTSSDERRHVVEKAHLKVTARFFHTHNRKMETDLVDADFSLHILQALLNDGDEGSRGHQRSIDVGLADVALYAKGEG